MSTDQIKAAEARWQRLVARNAAWAPTHQPSPSWDGFPRAPAVAVISCMDPRVIPEQLLDIGEMQVGVLRNAGGRVSDAMRSLYTLTGIAGENGGIACVAVIHHTDCGMMEFSREHNQKMLKRYGSKDAADKIDQLDFENFDDLEQSVKDDVAALKADPILSKSIIVIGYVYDVKTGLLREIVRE